MDDKWNKENDQQIKPSLQESQVQSNKVGKIQENAKQDLHQDQGSKR